MSFDRRACRRDWIEKRNDRSSNSDATRGEETGADKAQDVKAEASRTCRCAVASTPAAAEEAKARPHRLRMLGQYICLSRV